MCIDGRKDNAVKLVEARRGIDCVSESVLGSPKEGGRRVKGFVECRKTQKAESEHQYWYKPEDMYLSTQERKGMKKEAAKKGMQLEIEQLVTAQERDVVVLLLHPN